ncbi:MAG: heavy metal translocating P-type ATPase, partial [Bdellovibrionales bacterium]|nr:heavy metal translocating P-type ATPase [Bdellovibrionales bacterium]
RSAKTLQAVRKRDRTQLLIKLAVAGVVAGNVMMMSVSLYQADFTGIDEEFRKLLYLACFLVSLPAVCFSALPFYKRAFSGLRNKIIHIDLPVSIGIILGFCLSSYNAFKLNQHIYFDSITILIFLLLVGRWLQLFTLDWAQSQTPDHVELLPQYAVKVDQQQREETIFRKRLEVSDRVSVKAGDVFPADGIVISGESEVDNSVMTGEARLLTVRNGDKVFAGSRNSSAPLLVEVTACDEATKLGRLISGLETMGTHEDSTPRLIDQVSHFFVPVVLGLTLTCFLWWLSFSDFEEALVHSFALLIITCPCALGLAIPLSVSLSIARAGRQGLLIKNSDVFEPERKPEKVFFDKTGTLTAGTPQVSVWFAPDCALTEAELYALVLALEADVQHPLAVALEDFVKLQAPSVKPLDGVESKAVAGKGVQAEIHGAQMLLGSIPFLVAEGVLLQGDYAERVDKIVSRGETPVGLACGGKLLALFAVRSALLPASRDLVARLLGKGYQVEILSGDLQGVVDAVCKELGLEGRGTGGCSSEQKAQIVQKAQQDCTSIMVGDGVNDALALQAADIGIAVSGGAEAALKVADCYCLKNSLNVIDFMFATFSRTKKVIRLNLAVSLAYNVVGATLAFAGLISPLVAAILMPLSSVTVVFIAFLGTRVSDSGVSR